MQQTPFTHLFQGNCLDLFETVPDHSVGLIVCDPPYGTTQAKWDKLLPFAELWPQVERVLKPTGVALVFASQPFTSQLIMSNPKYYRNLWYWQKSNTTGHLLSGRQPLRCIEEICVFGRTPMSATYNPQMVKRAKSYRHSTGRKAGTLYKPGPWTWGEAGQNREYTHAHPTHLLQFDGVRDQLVATQKPVDLLRYMIRTYSNAGDVVFDPTMGSGSTGVACLEEGRNFIGFEMDEKHFEIASTRIEASKASLRPAPVLDELDDELAEIVGKAA